MTWLFAVVGFVAAQRLAELLYARRNDARLRAAGGIEYGRRHYPLFVLLHGGWLIALLLTVPPETTPIPALIFLFAMLQLARIWIIASLGRHWTTRVIVVPGAPLVAAGPYRFMRHPNYAVVVGEIAVLPLAFEAYAVAIVFSILNAALLLHRVRVENRALAAAQKSPKIA